MSNDRTPARLFTLLARDAPVGVIFRRGPSRWTQLIHWDTANDIFTAGQWFKGQIYPRKSDLSPNGSLLIYFAHKPFNHRANPTYGDQWTAISKPPYFTALALWQFRGSITDGGGGYFTTSKRVILEHYYYGDNQTPHPAHPPSGVKVEYLEEDTFSRNLYYELLRMRGWKSSFAPEVSRFGVPKIHVDGQWHRKWQSKLIWLKSNNHFMIKHRIFFDLSFLLPIWDYGSYREYQYMLLNKATGQEYDLARIYWADVDQRGRLVFAQDGKLLAANLDENGELNLHELADFNAHKPELVQTPKWARRW